MNEKTFKQIMDTIEKIAGFLDKVFSSFLVMLWIAFAIPFILYCYVMSAMTGDDYNERP